MNYLLWELAQATIRTNSFGGCKLRFGYGYSGGYGYNNGASYGFGSGYGYGIGYGGHLYNI